MMTTHLSIMLCHSCVCLPSLWLQPLLHPVLQLRLLHPAHPVLLRLGPRRPPARLLRPRVLLLLLLHHRRLRRHLALGLMFAVGFRGEDEPLSRGLAARLGRAASLPAAAAAEELLRPEGHLGLEDRRSLIWEEELLHQVVAQFVWLQGEKFRNCVSP